MVLVRLEVPAKTSLCWFLNFHERNLYLHTYVLFLWDYKGQITNSNFDPFKICETHLKTYLGIQYVSIQINLNAKREKTPSLTPRDLPSRQDLLLCSTRRYDARPTPKIFVLVHHDHDDDDDEIATVNYSFHPHRYGISALIALSPLPLPPSHFVVVVLLTVENASIQPRAESSQTANITGHIGRRTRLQCG